jgi:hypothetical protein
MPKANHHDGKGKFRHMRRYMLVGLQAQPADNRAMLAQLLGRWRHVDAQGE